MRLWIDEDLSPSLVDVAHRHSLDATCNRDRALFGGSDTEVMRRCIEEDRTLVTNNYGDFRRLCESQITHPGLIVLPTPSREKQRQLLDLALAYIERQAKTTGAADPGEFMINRVVEVGEDESCGDFHCQSHDRPAEGIASTPVKTQARDAIEAIPASRKLTEERITTNTPAFSLFQRRELLRLAQQAPGASLLRPLSLVIGHSGES